MEKDSKKIKYVPSLPDLMVPADYEEDARQGTSQPRHLRKKKVRIRICMSDGGLEILGDSLYPPILEKFLEGLDVREIEQTLCG